MDVKKPTQESGASEKAQEKEINLIAVPLCGMKRVYERMYEGILNIEDGAE